MNDASSVGKDGVPDSQSISATKAFHRLGQMIPDEQRVYSVSSNKMAAEAISEMNDKGFSQLPVHSNGKVVGLFSYRSYAKATMSASMKTDNDGIAIGDLVVGDCLEIPNFALSGDGLDEWIDLMDELEAVLVGFPERVHAILTNSDMIRHLYAFARPFVLVAEIEICLRRLITTSVDNSTLRECCDRALTKYRPAKRPYNVDEMSFGDYVALVSHEDNWEYFRKALGGQRDRTKAKLREANKLRNTIFHFSREVEGDDCLQLSILRNWMLQRATQLDASNEGGI